MPKKRSHGDGGLYFIKSRGLWRGVIDDGFWPDGRRRQRYVYGKTQADARAKLKTLRAELEQHGAPLDKAMTVEQWAEHWLRTVCEPNMKPAALQGYESAVNRWIVPTLRRKRVAQLKPSDVRAVTRAMFDAGRASSSALKVHAVLSSMLEAARLDGIIARNIASDVKAPSANGAERDALSTEAALDVLRTAAMHADGTRWWVALLAGLRQGERIGATLDSIDFVNHQFVVQWSLTEARFRHGCPDDDPCGRKRGGACPERKLIMADDMEYRQLDGRLCLVRPKSGKVRTIPLIPELEEALRRYVAASTGPNPHGLIWRHADGRPITAEQDQEAWRTVLYEAGVITAEQNQPERDRAPGTPLTPTTHVARHTTATVLMELGVDAKIIGEIVGHVSERTTRGYQHVSSAAARAALTALGEHFADAIQRGELREAIAA
jgi:integrase